MQAATLLGAGSTALAVAAFGTAALMSRRARRATRRAEQASARFESSEQRMLALVRNSNDVAAIVDRDGNWKFASPALERIVGRPVESLIGTSAMDPIHRDDRAHVLGRFHAVRERPGASSEIMEFRIARDDGSCCAVEALWTNLLDDASIRGIVVNLRDVTDRRSAEDELSEAEERFRSAFEHAPIGMALVSIDGHFFRVNRALAQMLGRASDHLLGAAVLGLVHPEDRPAASEQMSRLLSGELSSYQLAERYLHPDGRVVWAATSASLVRDAVGKPIYLVYQMEDITSRKRDGERLVHQAIHDPLTGLPNRLLFVDRLRRALAAPEESGLVAVFFLDLDHFKVVNDSLGHSAGDRLLVAIADRLRGAVRPHDTVARFGGDEFTILCVGVPDERTAHEIASRVEEAIAWPITLAEGEVFVTASLGIALAGGDEETPETLLRNSDAAMYRAKEQGRARIEMYDAGARERAVSHLRTGSALHRALERAELRVFYQPIVSLETGRVAGFEALVRWQHPERGLVGPDQFIGFAEESGLVVPIGEWVLEQACTQVRAWQSRGTPVSMSVNLSPRQLGEPELCERVGRVLANTKVDPESVWLEITETALMRDADSAVETLTGLRNLGVHVSVDDFGTGYSSMTYLKRFPVDALKVDRTFVDGIAHEPESTAICTAVVSLAHSLGLRAVAEGVENAEQVSVLRTLGCELAQGYLFGRPQPPDFYRPRRTLEESPSSTDDPARSLTV